MPVPPVSVPPPKALSRALVEEVVDLARGLGADPGHVGEIGQRGALDRLEGPEMVEQRALAGRADAGDFLQPRLADIAPAPDAVRSDREAMRLVAQPLDEIEHRIARLELERLPPGLEEGLHPRVPIRAFGDRKERHIDDAERRQRPPSIMTRSGHGESLSPSAPMSMGAPACAGAVASATAGTDGAPGIGRGASFISRLKRRIRTSRIMPKSSPGARSAARMLNLRY